ncbi:MAG: hypothetical protein JWN48_2801 [Myxococcaceae bacterium]|nr:hypothetical protein [Myxococcaceae bacterium]
MRPTYLALRLLAASCALFSLSGCAEGFGDEDLEGETVPSETADGGTKPATGKDAGKDATSTSGSLPTTGGGTKDASTGGSTGATKDASTGGSSGATKDASTGGGTTTPGAAIKCPSPMVCNTALAGIISIVDMSVKSTDNLCSTGGGILPMAVSCSSVDVCKSSRLTTATCVAGSCVQPCTP